MCDVGAVLRQANPSAKARAGVRTGLFTPTCHSMRVIINELCTTYETEHAMTVGALVIDVMAGVDNPQARGTE